MGLTPFQISSASWLELEGTFSIFTSRPGLPRGASTRVRIPRTSGNNTTRPNTLLPLPLTSLYTFSRSILVLWRQVLRQITTETQRVRGLRLLSPEYRHLSAPDFFVLRHKFTVYMYCFGAVYLELLKGKKQVQPCRLRKNEKQSSRITRNLSHGF